MNASGRPTNDDEPSLSDVVRALARYWRVNPLAGDTSEGILQWWLGLVPSSVDLVEQALASLEAEGLVQSVRALGTQAHYRRASIDARSDARLAEIIAASNDDDA